MNFSIIIPSYGQARYLREAIESALAQTVKCEVIVVDDGSTDGSLKIAEEYADRLKVIKQVNKGLAAARNTGIMNATGDWILPLDADDILMVNCVEKLMELHTKYPDADVLAPSFQTMGVVQEHITLMQEPQLEHFRTANRIGYFSAIKKSVLHEVGGYSSRMVWGAEDYALWFDLLTRGKKIVTTPEILVLYRTKEESMWIETQKHTKEFMQQIYKDYPSAWPKELQDELKNK
jgi:glycosyltransferase involved in cell wall biosynthesis